MWGDVLQLIRKGAREELIAKYGPDFGAFLPDPIKPQRQYPKRRKRMADNRRPSHSVSAKTGRTDAEGKAIYMNVGAAWETDRGMSLRISALPVPFDGSLYVNPYKEE